MADRVHMMIEGLIIEPGDRVLIATQTELEPEAAREIRDLLEEFFPDAEFIILSGATIAKVDRT